MSTTVVTFGEIMLRLSPPGFERLLQSPVLCATFGGGEANVAVSLAQFGLESRLRHAAAGATRSATRRSARCAPKACDTDRIVRGGSRIGDLLRRDRRQPARLDGHLRPRAFGDQRDAAGRGRLGRGDDGRGVVPRHRHHARARRQGRRGDRARRSRAAKRAGRARQRRSELPQEAVDRGAGAGGDAPADARRRRRHRQRGGPAVACSASTVEGADVTSGHAERRRLSRRRRSGSRASFGPPMVAITLRESLSASDNGWSAVLWDGATRRCTRASATTSGWSIASAAATASPAD